jgi:hypothetical protein
MPKALVCGNTVELTASDLSWLEEEIGKYDVTDILVIIDEEVTAQVTTWAAGFTFVLTEYSTAQDGVAALGSQGFVFVFVQDDAYSTVVTETELPGDAVVYYRYSPPVEEE